MAKKLYYKIGEACKELDIQPYVLRYWETEFSALSPSKSKSGQRVYSAEDLSLIGRIKELLYDEGYTIAGAKKKLEKDFEAHAKVTEELEPEDDGPDEEKPAAKPPPAAKPAARRKAGVKSTKVSPTSDDVKRLKKGIEQALEDAKGILSLLDS